MGRLSDIVLRGLQFEAQQEAQDLENEGRRLQMDKIVQERVAAGMRTKPGYAEAWDRITDPDIPTSEVGQYMARIPAQDIPDFMNARKAAQENRIRNEFAMDKLMEEARQRAALLEQRLEQQRELSEDRLEQQRILHGQDITSREKIATERVTAAEERGKAGVAAAEARGAKKYTPDDAVDAVARTVFGFPIAGLTSTTSTMNLSQKMGGVDRIAAAKIAQQAGNEVIRLQEAGLTADEALQQAIAGVKIKPKERRGLLKGPDVPPSPTFTSIEDQVDAAIAKADEDTPELRKALRQRILARGGQ